jgi:pimeloyl-ACP methyl ester carboxylesterase
MSEVYSNAMLPPGVRSRFIDGVNGLRMHILEAGFEGGPRPLLLLLHGFPELAYSWRKVILPLANAGYHVVAPDQRGYGRTTGWDADYDGDLASFRLLNLATDALALVARLGQRSAAAVIGHDFGSSVAAWCALTRPDVFQSVALMSAPFGGPPAWPAMPGTANAPSIHHSLAALPRPRKHYQWYYAERHANADMQHCPQGIHAFLRAYYHMKSADWADNRPFKLTGWTAAELAKLPTYYIMDRDQDMAATVAPHMPSEAAIDTCGWLPEAELAVFAAEFGRTGFQGGLQWYRGRTQGTWNGDLLYADRTIDVPALFIAGKSDWGIYQMPGHIEAMAGFVCSEFQGLHLIDGAGHWVQQERPADVIRLLLSFTAGLAAAPP